MPLWCRCFLASPRHRAEPEAIRRTAAGAEEHIYFGCPYAVSRLVPSPCRHCGSLARGRRRVVTRAFAVSRNLNVRTRRLPRVIARAFAVSRHSRLLTRCPRRVVTRAFSLPAFAVSSLVPSLSHSLPSPCRHSRLPCLAARSRAVPVSSLAPSLFAPLLSPHTLPAPCRHTLPAPCRLNHCLRRVVTQCLRRVVARAFAASRNSRPLTRSLPRAAHGS